MKPVNFEYLEKQEEKVVVAGSMKPRDIEYASQLAKDSPILVQKPGFEATEVKIKQGKVEAEAPSATCDGVNLVPHNKGHG